MLVFDQRQRDRLEELEIEVLNYMVTLPSAQAMDELKKELQHYGFSLGEA